MLKTHAKTQAKNTIAKQ